MRFDAADVEQSRNTCSVCPANLIWKGTLCHTLACWSNNLLRPIKCFPAVIFGKACRSEGYAQRSWKIRSLQITSGAALNTMRCLKALVPLYPERPQPQPAPGTCICRAQHHLALSPKFSSEEHVYSSCGSSSLVLRGDAEQEALLCLSCCQPGMKDAAGEERGHG